MVARRALVSVSGTISELPIGDSLIGGSVLSGSATLTMPGFGVYEDEEVISATGVTPSSKIFLTLQSGADSDENTGDMLDLVTLTGIPGTDQITVQMQFSCLTSGPVLINWSAM